MLTNRPTWNKVVAENLRNPLKSVLFQEAKECLAVRNRADGSFEGFIADLAPAGQVLLQAVGKIDSPKMADKFEFHSIGCGIVSEFFTSDFVRGDPEVGECFHAGLDHHRWPAKVKLDGFGIRVGFEVIFQNDFVDESGVRAPIVAR